MANVIAIDTSKKRAKSSKNKTSTSKAASKKKIDWRKIQSTVHYGFRVVIFRVIEAVILLSVIGTVTMIIGSTIVPMTAYDISAGIGLTQDTNIYLAFANWMLPMLFYVILLSLTTFFVFRRFIYWLHTNFTKIIRKKYYEVGKDTAGEAGSDNK